MEKLALTVEETAESIGVSDRKVRDLIHIDGFPVVRLGGRIVIPVEPLRNWLREKSESGEVVQ